MKQRDFMARHPEDVGRTVEDFSWVLNVIVRPVRPRFRNADYEGLALLKTLDWADFDLLAPHFRQVSLKQGSLLQEQEAPVERNLTLRYKEALITTRLPKGMQP